MFHYYLNDSPLFDDDGCNYGTFFLTDGSIVFYRCFKNEQLGSHQNKIKELNGKMKNRACEMAIDVNGDKKPNIVGRDVFHFALDNNGMLFPRSGVDYSIFWYGDKEYNKDSRCSVETKSSGHGCAARIMEEGWKMNY